MSEGLPKSARDVLAKQTAAGPGSPERPDLALWGGDAHPSPDLLNAFVEQSLSDDENGVVLGHLASCSECREVIFLTSGVAEEELLALVRQLPELMAARTPAKVLRVRPAAAPPQDGMQPGTKPRRQAPRRWWKWAVPALAAVVVVGIAVLERDNLREMMSPPPQQMAKVERPLVPLSQPNTPAANPQSHAEVAQNQPAVADNENALKLPPAQKKELAERDQLAKQQQAETTRREQAELSSKLDLPKDKRPGTSAELAAGAPKPAAPAGAAASPPSQTTVEVTSAAPLIQADNADLSTADSFKPNSLAKSAMPSNSAAGVVGALQTQRAAPTHWRISSDGHVEHTVGPSTWERVMSAEPVTFHVVATVGQNVWAGGSDGALYHSADGGHEWNRVALASEQGTIKTIHFNNAQQGSLTTEAGTVWTTSDGGATWTRQ